MKKFVFLKKIGWLIGPLKTSISLNGVPAYVADIQDFEVKDTLGNITSRFTRLHIPAILNANKADERAILFSYVVDENENYTLEGILRKSYESEGGFLVTSKEQIELKPRDEIQLIYEVFDAVTNIKPGEYSEKCVT